MRTSVRGEAIKKLQNKIRNKDRIIVISDRFIGSYGEIDKDSSYKDLRYVAGLLFCCSEKTSLNRLDFCRSAVIILDKGSKRIGANLFVNARGNVVLIKDYSHYYFDKRVSKIIINQVINGVKYDDRYYDHEQELIEEVAEIIAKNRINALRSQGCRVRSICGNEYDITYNSVQELLDNYGDRLEVINKDGIGTRFIVTERVGMLDLPYIMPEGAVIEEN